MLPPSMRNRKPTTSPRLPLEDLRVFDAVVRHGGIGAAADALALTQGAVSKRISALEAKAGVRLLERGSRKAAPTRAGLVLAASTAQALEALAAAWQAVAVPAADAGAHRLAVSCERSLALRWLIPRLGGFQALHPEVVVRVQAGGGPVDFGAEGADVAIRRDDFAPGRAVQTAPLMPEPMALVLAPALLPAWRQAPRTVRRLHSATRPDAWAQWVLACPQADGVAGRAAAPSQMFEHWFLAIQAAESGLGALVAPVPLVADALAQGRLVAPHGSVAGQGAYVLLWPRGRRSVWRDRFMAWLRGQVPPAQ